MFPERDADGSPCRIRAENWSCRLNQRCRWRDIDRRSSVKYCSVLVLWDFFFLFWFRLLFCNHYIPIESEAKNHEKKKKFQTEALVLYRLNILCNGVIGELCFYPIYGFFFGFFFFSFFSLDYADVIERLRITVLVNALSAMGITTRLIRIVEGGIFAAPIEKKKYSGLSLRRIANDFSDRCTQCT